MGMRGTIRHSSFINLQAPCVALADAVEERLGLLTFLVRKVPDEKFGGGGEEPAFMRKYVLVVYFFSQ